MKPITVDNISNETLDLLKAKYEGVTGFRINDDRKTISFGKPKEYFLIEYRETQKANGYMPEFCFIWIGSNLWQFRYVNIHCTSASHWISPTTLLNNLLRVNIKNLTDCILIADINEDLENTDWAWEIIESVLDVKCKEYLKEKHGLLSTKHNSDEEIFRTQFLEIVKNYTFDVRPTQPTQLPKYSR